MTLFFFFLFRRECLASMNSSGGEQCSDSVFSSGLCILTCQFLNEQHGGKKKKIVSACVNFCLKEATVTAEAGGGSLGVWGFFSRFFFPPSMRPIQRQITRSSSESCTYIKDAPDSPPAVAMEVAQM